MKELLKGDDNEVELCVDIFMYCKYLKRTDILNYFLNDIKNLSVHYNFKVRKFSREILISLKEKLPNFKYKPLSESFRLTFLKDHLVESIEQNNLAIENDHKLEFYRLFEGELYIISKLVDLPIENLLIKIESIISKLLDSKKEIYLDNNVKEFLVGVGFRLYSFEPLKFKVYKRAFWRVLSELIDAKKLDFKIADNIMDVYDYSINLMPIKAAPNNIKPLNGYKNIYKSQEWIDTIKTSSRITNQPYKEIEFIVIGEFSESNILNNSGFTEVRMSQIQNENNIINEPEYFFESSRINTDKYWLQEMLENIIFKNSNNRLGQYDIISQWLAFNPILAKEFGWSRNFEKLFAWKDSYGNLMVYSEYWENGDPLIYSYGLNSIKEAGWVVFASKKAIEQLRAKFNDLSIHNILVRDAEQVRRKVHHFIYQL